jgi:hypothetical protein
MPDDVLPEYMRRFIAEAARLAQTLPQVELPPPQVLQTAQALQPQIAAVEAAMERMAAANTVTGTLAGQQDTFAKIAESFAAIRRLPVPTARELSEAEAALRIHVLPEAPEQDVQEAIAEISDDPEKLKLAVMLTDLLQRAISVSPMPWLVFVLVFWVAMKLNSPEVAALALAYTVMRDYKPRD